MLKFIEKRNNPNYNFSQSELKIMRAIWLKNAPMNYSEILGACVSDYWSAEDAQYWINDLLNKGVIEQLDNGRYDVLISHAEYEKYLKRRKLYRHFHPEYPQDAPLAISSCFDPGPEAEYTFRKLDKMIEARKHQCDQRGK